jgi:hypothetical protein
MTTYFLIRKTTVISQVHIPRESVNRPAFRAVELFADQYQPGDHMAVELGQASYNHMQEIVKNDPTNQ